MAVGNFKLTMQVFMLYIACIHNM